MSPSEDGRKSPQHIGGLLYDSVPLHLIEMHGQQNVKKCCVVVGINIVKNVPPSLTLKTLFLYTPYVFRVDCEDAVTRADQWSDLQLPTPARLPRYSSLADRTLRNWAPATVAE